MKASTAFHKLSVACVALTAAILSVGCEPEKPVMEIKAPGIDIQVERSGKERKDKDITIDVREPLKPDTTSEDAKIKIKQ